MSDKDKRKNDTESLETTDQRFRGQSSFVQNIEQNHQARKEGMGPNTDRG